MICLTCSSLLPTGTKVDLRIVSVDPAIYFNLKGTVHWTEEEPSKTVYYIGIELDQDEGDTRVWQKFIHVNLSLAQKKDDGHSSATDDKSLW